MSDSDAFRVMICRLTGIVIVTSQLSMTLECVYVYTCRPGASVTCVKGHLAHLAGARPCCRAARRRWAVYYALL